MALSLYQEAQTQYEIIVALQDARPLSLSESGLYETPGLSDAVGAANVLYQLIERGAVVRRAGRLFVTCCGERTENLSRGRAICLLPPHSVEIKGGPLTRYHRHTTENGSTWAQWSSTTPEDSHHRLWPDGHIGIRPRHGLEMELQAYKVSSEAEARERLGYIEQLVCKLDTDGDGNCPNKLCPKCHSESFSTAQLARYAAETWPFRAVVMLIPAVEDDGGLEFASRWVADAAKTVLDAADEAEQRLGKPEKRLVTVTMVPVQGEVQFGEYSSALWRSFREELDRRGIAHDEPQQPSSNLMDAISDWRARLEQIAANPSEADAAMVKDILRGYDEEMARRGGQ